MGNNDQSADLGFIDQQTPATPGERQYFSISVPNRPSYLRIGETPPTIEDTLHLEEKWLHPYFDQMFKSVDSDGSEHMQGTFIHAAVDALALHEGAGWLDFCEGNRITTTTGDKVEVIRGNYKLITCGGDAGIDFSGGHMRTWSKTPGYISQVDADGNEATMTIEAEKRYAQRFYGGDYDELFGGKSYRGFYGVDPENGVDPAAPPPGGIPAIGERAAVVPMDVYHQEIHAKSMSERYTGDRHSSVITAKEIEHSLDAKVAVRQFVKVGATSISQTATPTKIEERYVLGSAGVGTTMDESETVQTVTRGTSSATLSVSGNSIEDSWKGFRQTTIRRGDLGSTMSAYKAHLSFDDSLLKVDQIASAVWLESHIGMKLVVGKSVVVDKQEAPVCKFGNMEVSVQKLTIFA